MKITEYLKGKTKKQRVLLIIGAVFALIFLAFIFKYQFENKSNLIHINPIDAGVLITLCAACVIHKIKRK